MTFRRQGVCNIVLVAETEAKPVEPAAGGVRVA
jgi:hypothetical protein